MSEEKPDNTINGMFKRDATIGSLFTQLEEFGAGSMSLTTSDSEGNVLGCIIVAKGESARDILTYYDQDDEREAALMGEVEL